MLLYRSSCFIFCTLVCIPNMAPDLCSMFRCLRIMSCLQPRCSHAALFQLSSFVWLVYFVQQYRAGDNLLLKSAAMMAAGHDGSLGLVVFYWKTRPMDGGLLMCAAYSYRKLIMLTPLHSTKRSHMKQSCSIPSASSSLPPWQFGKQACKRVQSMASNA